MEELYAVTELYLALKELENLWLSYTAYCEKQIKAQL
jgi:hypothetical protein